MSWERIGALWRKKGYLSGFVEIKGVRLPILVVVSNGLTPSGISHFVLCPDKKIEEIIDEL